MKVCVNHRPLCFNLCILFWLGSLIKKESFYFEIYSVKYVIIFVWLNFFKACELKHITIFVWLNFLLRSYSKMKSSIFNCFQIKKCVIFSKADLWGNSDIYIGSVKPSLIFFSLSLDPFNDDAKMKKILSKETE